MQKPTKKQDREISAMNMTDEIARIEQAQRDVRGYVAAMHKSSERENVVAAMFAIGGIALGAALFGAGMAFAKLIA